MLSSEWPQEHFLSSLLCSQSWWIIIWVVPPPTQVTLVHLQVWEAWSWVISFQQRALRPYQWKYKSVFGLQENCVACSYNRALKKKKNVDFNCQGSISKSCISYMWNLLNLKNLCSVSHAAFSSHAMASMHLSLAKKASHKESNARTLTLKAHWLITFPSWGPWVICLGREKNRPSLPSRKFWVSDGMVFVKVFWKDNSAA